MNRRFFSASSTYLSQNDLYASASAISFAKLDPFRKSTEDAVRSISDRLHFILLRQAQLLTRPCLQAGNY